MEDDALLAEVGAAIREHVGAVPDRVVAAGKQVCTWRTIDAEIAAVDVRLPARRADRRRAGLGRRAARAEVRGGRADRRAKGREPAGGAPAVWSAGPSRAWRGVADRFGRFVVPLPSRPEYVDLRFIRSAEPLVALLAYL